MIDTEYEFQPIDSYQKTIFFDSCRLTKLKKKYKFQATVNRLIEFNLFFVLFFIFYQLTSVNYFKLFID